MLISLYFWPPMHAGKAAPAARESPEAKRWETKVWLACTEMVRPKEAQVRHQQPLRCLCNRHVQRVHSILISSTPNPFLLVFPVLVNGHYSCSQKPWVLDSSLLHSTFNLSANPIISTSKYSPSQPLLSPSLPSSWPKPPLSLAWIILIGSQLISPFLPLTPCSLFSTEQPGWSY